MSPTDRLLDERTFHDRQARTRAVDLASLDALRFRDEAYLDHETWIRPALARLGSVSGLKVLDFGCGHGMAGVVLARHGALVTGFDLSHGYVAEAQRRAIANDVSIDFVQADGERLPFTDGSFDRVWGNAILHHLDLTRAAQELHRILKPGGVAVFCEPWGDNPLLSFARHRLPYPCKSRTPDEQPLTSRQLGPLRKRFPHLRTEGFQLLGMVRRAVRGGRWLAPLDVCDAILVKIPGLWRLCRYVVLSLPREFV
jgi:SAM-dependent methyltransferase